MSGYPYSVVQIVPAALRDAADAAASAMQGLYANAGTPGDRTHLVPVSADGAAPASHWLAQFVAAERVAEMLGESADPPALDWTMGGAQDLDAAGVAAVAAGRFVDPMLISEIEAQGGGDNPGAWHIAHVLGERGLQVVQPEFAP
ncbi:MAG: hypothetical protein GOVbin1573_36 [Prokaryotic dsDNA virus sp.]|nr:MAG: hypothetical protein GOVbin1573_36 [Prokaryotic dsDNA virus sp.]|tara:strand:+ start:16287 stop:16721 length:435 start_codon:yes stop_codon:yes gene_type:complete